MNLPTPSPEQMRLIAQVLTLHLVQGRLQSEIATELGLSTAKVNRLIKQGRELGMVQVTIKSPLLRLFDLELALAKRWNLKDCLVVPAIPGSAETTLNEVGKGVGTFLLDKIKDGDTIAISGGKTLSAVITNVAAARAYDVTVVPMTGGVQGQHYTDVNHLATELASKLSGKATLIHAPLHATSERERDLLMSFKSACDVMDQARNATIAIVGIGAVAGADSTYYEARPAAESERKQLNESGVRSEFLGHLINWDGSLSGNEHNRRLVSLPPDEVAKIPITVAVASGVEKVEPITAALNGGYFNSLVTDENTARAVLNKETRDA